MAHGRGTGVGNGRAGSRHSSVSAIARIENAAIAIIAGIPQYDIHIAWFAADALVGVVHSDSFAMAIPLGTSVRIISNMIRARIADGILANSGLRIMPRAIIMRSKIG